jgi:RNA polymerase sigma-70 factor (ECF subfamily)
MLFSRKATAPPGDRTTSASEALERGWVARIALGDRAAFEALYRCYFPRLMRFLRRLLRQPHTIEEVLDDTLLVVWRKAASFQGESKVSTWVFAIAYRRAMKTHGRFDDPLEYEGDAIDEQGLQPEQALLQRQLGATLDRALDAISANQRAVVELTYFHGCRYQEIAEIMDCPVETVKTRMFHARRKLRELLAARREDLP